MNLRPGHHSSAEYYSVPGDNLRTYPVYHPDAEPAGYWQWLQAQKPAPLVDVATIRNAADWIAAGERAFVELDGPLSRTGDPQRIAQARDPAAFTGAFKLRDGTALGPRWVVTQEGVQLSFPACAACHFTIKPDNTVTFAGPGGPPPPGTPRLNPRGSGGATPPCAVRRRSFPATRLARPCGASSPCRGRPIRVWSGCAR